MIQPHSLPVPSSASEASHLGSDGLYHNCVVEDRYLDVLGRRSFVAVDAEGRELARSVAANADEVVRVCGRLWEVVDTHRTEGLHIIR